MTTMKTKHIVSNVVNIRDPDIGFLCRAAPLYVVLVFVLFFCSPLFLTTAVFAAIRF